MSLDIYLKGGMMPAGSGIFIHENGSTLEISREEWDAKFPGKEPVVARTTESNEAYSANITHNLGAMASAAGIYEHLWLPDEIGVKHAHQLVHPLQTCLAKLQAEPDKFRALNPKNGWGDYDGLVRFVAEYLAACEANPNATVGVSR